MGVTYGGGKKPLPDLDDDIPQGAAIVCHCTAGLRSGFVAQVLENKWERPVHSLHGGIVSWSNAGGELREPGTGTTTDRVNTYSGTWGRFLSTADGREAVY